MAMAGDFEKDLSKPYKALAIIAMTVICKMSFKVLTAPHWIIYRKNKKQNKTQKNLSPLSLLILA